MDVVFGDILEAVLLNSRELLASTAFMYLYATLYFPSGPFMPSPAKSSGLVISPVHRKFAAQFFAPARQLPSIAAQLSMYLTPNCNDYKNLFYFMSKKGLLSINTYTHLRD